MSSQWSSIPSHYVQKGLRTNSCRNPRASDRIPQQCYVFGGILIENAQCNLSDQRTQKLADRYFSNRSYCNQCCLR